MNKMTTMFQEILIDGIGSLESGELEKAAVYAEFAKAMAMTGTVCVIPSEVGATAPGAVEIKEEVTTKTVTPKQDLPKAKAEEKPQEKIKLEAVKKVEVEPIPKPEIKAEETVSPSLLQAQEDLVKYTTLFGEDVVVQCLSEFSHNTLTTIDDIVDDNVEAFISYLDILMQETETA